MLATKERFRHIRIQLRTDECNQVLHGYPGKRRPGDNEAVLACVVDCLSDEYEDFIKAVGALYEIRPAV